MTLLYSRHVASAPPVRLTQLLENFKRSVDNEFTVKYLEYDKAGLYLKPGNRAYPNIRPHHHLEVFGLAVDYFRILIATGHFRAVMQVRTTPNASTTGTH